MNAWVNKKVIWFPFKPSVSYTCVYSFRILRGKISCFAFNILHVLLFYSLSVVKAIPIEKESCGLIYKRNKFRVFAY